MLLVLTFVMHRIHTMKADWPQLLYTAHTRRAWQGISFCVHATRSAVNVWSWPLAHLHTLTHTLTLVDPT